MNRRLIFDTDVKAVREEKLMGLRPEIYDEYDLIDAVPDADLSELWIPVEERVPDVDVSVLLICKNGAMFVGRRTHRYSYGKELRWCVGTALGSAKMLNKGRVTHWMPLPGVPKKEDA